MIVKSVPHPGIIQSALLSRHHIPGRQNQAGAGLANMFDGRRQRGSVLFAPVTSIHVRNHRYPPGFRRGGGNGRGVSAGGKKKRGQDQQRSEAELFFHPLSLKRDTLREFFVGGNLVEGWR